MLYGEAFDRVGVKDMGRQGSGWCGFDPHGTLVLMAHQNYFKRTKDAWLYEVPDEGPMPHRASSAARSLDMIDGYFAPRREIVLLVGAFRSDGGMRADGTIEPSDFQEATGDAYRASMVLFDRSSGHLICELESRFSI
jgi:hypothetical protein